MKSLFIICVLIAITVIAGAQQPIQFFAHEEQVKPAMNGEYVEWLKKVKLLYEKNQVNLSYSVFVQDDYTYLFFSEIENFGVRDIYKQFSDAESKLGTEVMYALYKEKAAYIHSNQEFITQLLPQYTYLSPAEGDHFRHMMFWVPLPGSEDEAHKIAKEWVEMHKAKKAPNGYQTFQTVFGDEPAWVIVTWGKDEADNAIKSQKNSQLFGEQGGKLWARTMKITQKIYHDTGWFLPDLSYSYKPAAVK